METSENQKTEALKPPMKAIYPSELNDRASIRVAAYARVRTNNIGHASNLEIQQAHYVTYIDKQEGWILTQIYADESANTRNQFNKMLDDARAGKFDLIITKSVTRFACNPLDGIKTARELLHLPVPVGILFEEEALNTFRPDSEIILSAMLMMAQGGIHPPYFPKPVDYPPELFIYGQGTWHGGVRTGANPQGSPWLARPG